MTDQSQPFEQSTARQNHLTVFVDFTTGQTRVVASGEEAEMARAVREAQSEARVRLLTTAAA